MSTPTIDQAIDALRKLSPQRQQELAGYICTLAADDREPEDIAPADLPAVLEGLRQVERRQFASPERIAAALGLNNK
jgi:hypothetical protein